MRFALINSGLGLLATASELHKLRPDADLIIAMDPDGMPWGPRTPQDIAERSLALARATAAYGPDVIIMACNTGSVHALDVLRSEFEPDVPVVGTVPAIKPAAAAAPSVAIWATVATTESAYQRRLIAEFGGGADVTAVACPGLATAVDAGDSEAIGAAIADAAGRTPESCGAVVLGCTEYELAADQIGAAVAGAILFGSAAAVATQALRRASLRWTSLDGFADPDGRRAELAGPQAGLAGRDGSRSGEAATGTLTVLLSGRLASLPPTALHYRQGRQLAQLEADRDPASGFIV
jgi:glutamate racemase